MERTPEPEVDDEAGILVGWLNFHRDALEAKCEGITDEQLASASAPPSTLTLLGLVRHLTEMEGHYLVHALSGQDGGWQYTSDADPEADIENVDAGMAKESMARWHAVRAAADELIAGCPDMSAGVAAGWGSVRWHLAKMVQEYARHNGHADIIRERIDGSRGE